MRLSLPWDTIIKALPKTTLPLINIGFGEDLTIGELAEAIADAAGFTGAIEWDRTKPDGTPRKLMNISRMPSSLSDLRNRSENEVSEQANLYVMP